MFTTPDDVLEFWFDDVFYMLHVDTVEHIDQALIRIRAMRDGTYKSPWRTTKISAELYWSIVDKLLDRRKALGKKR